MWYALGITNGNQTLIQIRTNTLIGWQGDWWFPACWFGFWFDFLAIVTFFVFEKQRRFPGCITGLLCLVDMIHFFREILKAAPTEAISEAFFWGIQIPMCYAQYLWVAWVEAADFVLTISLAVVIYRTIVRKEDVSSKTDPTFIKIVFTIFILYPLVWISMVGGVASVQGFARKGLSCAPISNGPAIMGIVQCCVALVIMAVLLGVSLKYPLYTLVGDKNNGKDDSEVYIWQVVRQVRNLSDSHQNRKAWLTIRFILIMFLQTTPRLSYNFFYLSLLILGPAVSGKPTNGQMQSYILIPLCYWLNALVVLWGNKSLHKWLRGNLWKYVSLGDKSTASNNSQANVKLESIDSN